ncbi:MAG: pantetheine-phosphate adenylyltransferase [Acholeplasmatales bacterium]|nr:pantetheine-phosphate adenylyltransferase [Acholeplasmatales bacterium]
MRKACYPGSFDPISNGHLDIIERASRQFDEVHVLVSYNVNKKSTFTPDERVDMIKRACKNIKNVVVSKSSDLTVKYCKENGIQTMVRGLRNYMDYENEFSLYQFNRDIDPKIETLLLFPSTRTQFVSSSSIKELVAFNLDITPYVPKEIIDEVISRLKK